MKPLFVPLKTEYFRAFERGEKSTEYRKFGPRWNRDTCVVGREVTLSHGYSGARIKAVIRRFEVRQMKTDIYGDCATACIHVTVL